ncbi:hypothetical protein [Pyrobaculum aerophilum]|uniref:hypothetical protein n=1 Tax=Pyrobaculum aerophilum TaxID=13773 RepID=UPI002163C787|nr:hypothetical protein [Pyrobaculum aerophilum]
MVLVNYGYNFYSWNLATISYPTVKLGGNRAIVVTVDIVRGPGSSGYVPPIPVTITLNYVDTSRDPWVTVSPSNVNIPPGGTATFSLTVRPPSDAIPTTYIGQIVVINNVTGWWNSIPYTFNVFTTVDGNFKVLTSGANGRWPILNRIRGANDWAWRYESGDWRWFYARPSGSNGLAFEFQALWSAPDTSLIAYALGPDGQFAGVFYGQGASLHYHLGSGVFEWSNTGAGSIQNARRVVIFPAVEYRYWLYPHTKPETGVYTFIVRTALYDGITGASEPFTAQIRLLPAAQKLPSTIIGSGSATIRFSLPYIVGSMDAYMSRPYTPLLSVDQRYTPIYASISPSTLAGPYPANTQFTFQVNVYHNGAPGQSVDISALFLARLPSLPVYMRYNNNYYRETDSYIFEDWLTLTR